MNHFTLAHKRWLVGFCIFMLTLALNQATFAHHENKDPYRKQRWTVEQAPEHAPTKGTPSPTKTSIYWVFKDAGNPDETGFVIHDKDHKVVATTGVAAKPNSTYLEEKGLTEGTEYCNRHVHAFNGAGESPASEDLMCARTLDSVAPVVSDVKVESITESIATVLWKTDVVENTNDIVYYWKDNTGYLSATNTASSTIEHSVKLTGLATGTIYSYLPASTDPGSNEGRGATLSFTTIGGVAPVASAPVPEPLATPTLVAPKIEAPTPAVPKPAVPAPKLLNSEVSKINTKEATITWETDKNSKAAILYLKEGDAKPTEIKYDKKTKKHSMKVTKLTSGTIYQVALYVIDPETSESSQPKVLTFKTTGKKPKK